MRILTFLPLAGAALTLASACLSPVEGQPQPVAARRAHVRIGVGPGWSLLGTPVVSWDATEEEPRFLGPSAFIGVANKINDHISLGVEVNGWTGTRYERKRRAQLGLHAVGYLYPAAGGKFFLKGGLGLGVVAIDRIDRGTEDWGASLGYLIGMGYDMPVWGATVITPYLEVPFVRRFRGGVPNVIEIGLALGRW